MTPPHPLSRIFRQHLPLLFAVLPTLAGLLTPARADDAAPPAATAPAQPMTTMLPAPAPSLKPTLPIDFADFASDYKPAAMVPEWLNVEVAIMETTAAPLPGMPSGSIPEEKWTQQMAVDFKPISMTCVIGAKTRFDNVMILDADKDGHPLGYSLPLGQIVYFLARGETSDGIYYSVHVYEASEVNWVPNPNNPGSYVPLTRATVVSKDVIARADTYTYFLLSSRVPPPRPDVPIRPATLYTYLIVHIHKLDEAPPAAPTGLVAPDGGSATPGS
jgi:hypothetical protein